jgi:hypothetical protein
MTYRLYDVNDREVTHADLQNRAVWYRHGVKKAGVDESPVADDAHVYRTRLKIALF